MSWQFEEFMIFVAREKCISLTRQYIEIYEGCIWPFALNCHHFYVKCMIGPGAVVVIGRRFLVRNSKIMT